MCCRAADTNAHDLLIHPNKDDCTEFTGKGVAENIGTGIRTPVFLYAQSAFGAPDSIVLQHRTVCALVFAQIQILGKPLCIDAPAQQGLHHQVSGRTAVDCGQTYTNFLPICFIIINTPAGMGIKQILPDLVGPSRLAVHLSQAEQALGVTKIGPLVKPFLLGTVAADFPELNTFWQSAQIV